MKNYKLYEKESHELALKHLLEKFILELKYNKDISLKELINISNNSEIFTNEEYITIFNKSKNNHNK